MVVEKKLAHTSNVSSDVRNSGLLDLLNQLKGFENTDPGLASCYAELETVSSLLDSLIKDKHSEFEACPVGFTKKQRKDIVVAFNSTLPYINVEVDKGNAAIINYANTVRVIIEQENAVLKSKETRKKNVTDEE